MKASILDLRRRTRDVVRALERGESVTVLYRGKEKGVIHPTRPAKGTERQVSEHPAFGMWRDRRDMRDVERVMEGLRGGRARAL
jgi:antitoxin (DNA-binding transcriptional repressor) of toxin-antitoxin stability system